MSKYQLGAVLTIILGSLSACGASQGASSEAPAEQGPGLESTEGEPSDADAEEDNSAQTDKWFSGREYGKFVHFDLVTSKPVAAADFYRNLFGWTVTAVADGGPLRFVIENEGLELARIREHDPAGTIPLGWMSWISVEDIDDMMRDVLSNDGRILTQPQKSDRGRQAVISGPTGGVFGIIELGADATPDRPAQPGDFVLSQLWTSDFKVALGFYSVIGDYATTDVKYRKTEYSIMRGQGIPRALIRSTPKGRANRWIPFVYSHDVDKLTKRARSLGAKVRTSTREIPTIGRVAVIEAPTGGVIGFINPIVWNAKSREENDL